MADVCLLCAVLGGHPVSAAAAHSEEVSFCSPDMGQVCRLCAAISINTTNIFSEKGLELRLPEKIQKCLPVLVSRDHLVRVLISVSTQNGRFSLHTLYPESVVAAGKSVQPPYSA